MPIYEYVCSQCGNEFEVIQGFSDKPVRKCEVCGGKVRKLVSQSSFHLKGSGWYVTDYASKHPGSKPKQSKDSDGSDSKTETKSKDSSSSSSDSTSTKKSDKKSDKTKSPSSS